MTQPLLGVLPSLDSLFHGFLFQLNAPENHVLLTGLPGTVRPGSFLFAKPRAEVREAICARCTNGVVHAPLITVNAVNGDDRTTALTF